MPIYTYCCSSCRKSVDIRSSIKDRDNPRKCTNRVIRDSETTEVECGAELVRDEISLTANMKLDWALWQANSEMGD